MKLAFKHKETGYVYSIEELKIYMQDYRVLDFRYGADRYVYDILCIPFSNDWESIDEDKEDND